MAEDRIGSARQNRRHPATVGRQGGMADGVDAPMDNVQPSLLEPSLNAPPAYATFEQLLP
jgi:hypothetical protein